MLAQPEHSPQQQHRSDIVLALVGVLRVLALGVLRVLALEVLRVLALGVLRDLALGVLRVLALEVLSYREVVTQTIQLQ